MTEAISQRVGNIEIAALPSVARNDAMIQIRDKEAIFNPEQPQPSPG
jgi:hypothetical protein